MSSPCGGPPSGGRGPRTRVELRSRPCLPWRRTKVGRVRNVNPTPVSSKGVILLLTSLSLTRQFRPKKVLVRESDYKR